MDGGGAGGKSEGKTEENRGWEAPSQVTPAQQGTQKGKPRRRFSRLTFREVLIEGASMDYVKSATTAVLS